MVTAAVVTKDSDDRPMVMKARYDYSTINIDFFSFMHSSESFLGTEVG